MEKNLEGVTLTTDSNDEISTYSKAHTSFRLPHDRLALQRITNFLGIEPGWKQTKGRPVTKRTGSTQLPEIGVWLVSTKDAIILNIYSIDSYLIIIQLKGKNETLKRIQSEGIQTDIFCYRLSADRQGGPTLSSAIMGRLGGLEAEIGLEISGPINE